MARAGIATQAIAGLGWTTVHAEVGGLPHAQCLDWWLTMLWHQNHAHDRAEEQPLRLGFLLFPGFPMACLTSAIEPLRAANEISGRREFSWRLVAETDKPVAASAEILFQPDQTLHESESFDHLYLLGPPTARFADPRRSPARLRWLERLGVTLGAFSGGIFPLAETGLLDGRVCSVHWCYEAAFRAAYPAVIVSNRTIVRGNRRNTASGAAAVFDLMLELIKERLGRAIMIEVACWFQHPLVHEGGGPQRIPIAHGEATLDHLSRPVREAIGLFETHLEDPLRIADVARAVGLSCRHFERLFRQETGKSPLNYYHSLRLQKARQRVLYSDEPLSKIAAALGYASTNPLTRRYVRLFGVSPREDRQSARTVGRGQGASSIASVSTKP